jgi:hypothetical protein
MKLMYMPEAGTGPADPLLYFGRHAVWRCGDTQTRLFLCDKAQLYRCHMSRQGILCHTELTITAFPFTLTSSPCSEWTTRVSKRTQGPGSGRLCAPSCYCLLPVVLYACEIRSVALKGEHRLGLFGNSVPRRIFGPERDEMT